MKKINKELIFAIIKFIQKFILNGGPHTLNHNTNNDAKSWYWAQRKKPKPERDKCFRDECGNKVVPQLEQFGTCC